jgi:hypothetical protein
MVFMGVNFEVEQREARERSVEAPGLKELTAPGPQVV